MRRGAVCTAVVLGLAVARSLDCDLSLAGGGDASQPLVTNAFEPPRIPQNLSEITYDNACGML